MKFLFVTLFPEQIEQAANHSIIQRAVNKGLVEISCINPREFTHDVHRTVDDTPFGGGAGMVLAPEPLFECVESLRTPDCRVILMCPQGHRFRQSDARRLSGERHLMLVCGHYEGIDERARQCLFDEELSLGDFVLTNGALAAVVMTDAIVRLLPGVLGDDLSSEEESFGDLPLLEYPQYTRPVEFRGMRVPDVLLSGNHGEITNWRLEQRVIRTVGRRPDLLSRIADEDR